MAYQQKPEFSAEAKKQHPVFPVGVAIIVKLNGKVIKENSGRLFKGNSMFLQVSFCFCRIPFEFYPDHICNVTTLSSDVK